MAIELAGSDLAPVALDLAPDLLAAARTDGGAPLRSFLEPVRERLRRELGVRLPGIALRPAPLTSGSWVLLVDELPIAAGQAPATEALSFANPSDLALVGIEALPAERGVIVSLEDADRASALGPVLRPLERALAEAGTALLDELEELAPALVRETARQLPAHLLAEVLRRLLEEGVSIRPLRTILEAILAAGGPSRGAPALAACCRRALRHQIGRRVAPGGTVEALLLDPALETLLRESSDGEHAVVGPGVADGLLRSLGSLPAGGRPVLIAASDIRRPLRNLLAARRPELLVVACDELPPNLAVLPVGRVEIAA
jgi:type III secretion protein V